MAVRADITPEILRQLLEYDPETGLLYWKARDESVFADVEDSRGPAWAARRWNVRYAGKPALDNVQGSGYKKGSVLSVPVLAHRVAFAIHHGRTDFCEIDHINGDKTDNRITNLRDVAHSDNARNVGLYKNNTSGHHGVMWEESHKAWAAKITFGGKQRRIGRFKVKEDAIAARKAAEILHGYHVNHGRNQ